MRGHSGVCRKAFLAAFPYTIPILTGFYFWELLMEFI